MAFLAEADKSFWDHAEKIALDAFQRAIGVDIGPFVDFFRSTLHKYRLEVR